MKRLVLIILFINAALLPYGAQASGIDPVSIITELVKIYNLENNNLPNLSKLTDILAVQNKTKDDIEKDLQGNFGYGHLFNDDNALKNRQWSNDSWLDVLNETKTSSAFSEAQAQYKKLYPVIESSEIGATRINGGLNRTYYQQSSSISRAALAASSYSYDQINGHIKTLHDILAKLEDNPSEKSAIDINARLVAEVGFIELELLKQQTIQNQLNATQTQGVVNGMSDATQFMQWSSH